MNGTFLEHFDIDLRSLHNITRFESQGRSASDEFVTEYKLMHSIDGLHWIGAFSHDGYEQVLFLFRSQLSDLLSFFPAPDSLCLSGCS